MESVAGRSCWRRYKDDFSLYYVLTNRFQGGNYTVRELSVSAAVMRYREMVSSIKEYCRIGDVASQDTEGDIYTHGQAHCDDIATCHGALTRAL